MKFWLSQHGGDYYILLKKSEDTQEYIEASLYILGRIFRDRHKRVNLRVLFTRYRDDLPADCNIFYYFPILRGYSRKKVFEWPIIYLHEVLKIYREMSE